MGSAIDPGRAAHIDRVGVAAGERLARDVHVPRLILEQHVLVELEDELDLATGPGPGRVARGNRAVVRRDPPQRRRDIVLMRVDRDPRREHVGRDRKAPAAGRRLRAVGTAQLGF